MDTARNAQERMPRGPLEQAVLAVLGWAALTAEGADDLADEMARRVGLDRDAMRGAVSDVLTAWRREGGRLDTRRGDVVDGLVARLGLAHEAQIDDLALRVAQLEHRLKLLELDA